MSCAQQGVLLTADTFMFIAGEEDDDDYIAIITLAKADRLQ